MRIKKVLLLFFILSSISACLAVKIVDTAIDTTVGVTKTAVKTTGKVAGAVIPDRKEEEQEE